MLQHEKYVVWEYSMEKEQRCFVTSMIELCVKWEWRASYESSIFVCEWGVDDM